MRMDYQELSWTKPRLVTVFMTLTWSLSEVFKCIPTSGIALLCSECWSTKGRVKTKSTKLYNDPVNK